MTQKFLVINYDCDVLFEEWYISDNETNLKLCLIKNYDNKSTYYLHQSTVCRFCRQCLHH